MNDVIISDLPVAKNLTPDFVEAFEEFIPRWLGTIVKPYKEAKKKGVDMLQLMNFLNMGAPAEIYEADGIGYYLHDGSGLRMLGFDADHPNRRYWGWYECFQQQYPEVVDDSEKRIKNFMYYRPFTSRLYLKDSLYQTVASRIDSIFKGITGDTGAGFSFGSWSFVYFNDRALDYINRNHIAD